MNNEAAQWMRRYESELRQHAHTIAQNEDLQQALEDLLTEYIGDSRRLVPDPESAASVKKARALLSSLKTSKKA